MQTLQKQQQQQLQTLQQQQQQQQQQQSPQQRMYEAMSKKQQLMQQQLDLDREIQRLATPSLQQQRAPRSPYLPPSWTPTLNNNSNSNNTNTNINSNTTTSSSSGGGVVQPLHLPSCHHPNYHYQQQQQQQQQHEMITQRPQAVGFVFDDEIPQQQQQQQQQQPRIKYQYPPQIYSGMDQGGGGGGAGGGAGGGGGFRNQFSDSQYVPSTAHERFKFSNMTADEQAHARINSNKKASYMDDLQRQMEAGRTRRAAEKERQRIEDLRLEQQWERDTEQLKKRHAEELEREEKGSSEKQP
eukprot:CAMPEP_0175138526 /NCGR_PEP_ID=MMETSP0087-20121206/10402_1 /TAXON_ID=136419 /ORGANISM="Unknown Unknown, Strain D1" /LENGTH=297 /DNA_ID=CAMNT_0016421447 /DNA_START=112 /DNA_END=1005 /DNA_ORIENTATION=-